MLTNSLLFYINKFFTLLFIFYFRFLCDIINWNNEHRFMWISFNWICDMKKILINMIFSISAHYINIIGHINALRELVKFLKSMGDFKSKLI